MKVKIKNKIYDTNDEAVMLIFENSDERKKLISKLRNMMMSNKKYCMYPDGEYNIEEIKKFMKTKD